MAEKIKITAPRRSDKVEIVGLDELVFHAIDQEALLSLYERFAEDVILMCVMPEVPRYVMEDERREDTKIPDGYDALQRLLVRYRKMVSFMRKNGIDVEAVVGEDNNSKTKS